MAAVTCAGKVWCKTCCPNKAEHATETAEDLPGNLPLHEMFGAQPDLDFRPADDVDTVRPFYSFRAKPEANGKTQFEAFYGLGSGPFSPEQAARLSAAVPDEDLDVLPTGEVYLSQIGYRLRLTEAFGPGAWGLYPMSVPTQQGKTLTQEWALVVLGRVIAIAVGEQDYNPEPKTRWGMSYASALESIKSNALMRCCKDLGVAAQCWSKTLTERWKRQYCVHVYRTRKDGEETDEWRKLDAGPHWNETGLHPGSPNAEAWMQQMAEAGKGGRLKATGKPPKADPDDQRSEAERRDKAAQAAAQAATEGNGGDAPISSGQYGLLKQQLLANSVDPANVFLWLHEVKGLSADALIVERNGARVEAGHKIPARLYDDVLDFIRGGGEWQRPS